ncbi:MAG TPA: glycoside hydrolase family 43 protein [Flavitalea sp.]|nr:glycoside hydrolase family 43 protein [Flavitalea sp.]
MYRGMKVWLLLLVLSTTLSCGKGGSDPDPVPPPPPPPPSNTFKNPLLTSGPDPWIIRRDGFYYYTHTLGNRISLWKTAKVSDLKNAQVLTIWTPPATGPNSRNIWAPELHFLGGKWYIYYTAGSSSDLATQRTFVLENANADPLSGPWVEKGQLVDPAADFFAIDGTVLTYNGSNYFLWSGHASLTDNTQRIYIAKMLNPWTLETPRALISSPDYSWEKVGSPPAVNEGPEILVNPSGKIFLVFSASGCWTDDYALGMLALNTGGNPLTPGDWTKAPAPVFSKKTANSVYGPGHNSFFKSPDGTEDWILYHANPASGQGCGDARSPRIQKFTWNADGTPNFGEPVSTTANIQKPSGE